MSEAKDARESAVRDGRLRLAAVQRELDQARQMLADAPHDNVTCATWYGPQDATCSCWKAGL